MLREWEEYLRPSAETLLRRCKARLVSLYGKENVFSEGDLFVYAVGETPMCLTAHVDTVRGDRNSLTLLKEGCRIWNADGILGADDRAGVRAIFEVLDRTEERPSILLTNYEESGGKGCLAWLNSDRWSGNDNLFIGLDRRGCGEYVTYNGRLHKEVGNYVESFGFDEGVGTFSDVALITDSLEVPSVNLSVGFVKEHSPHECLFTDAWELTVSRVLAMVERPLAKLYRHVQRRSYFSFFRKKETLSPLCASDALADPEVCQYCPYLLWVDATGVECEMYGTIERDHGISTKHTKSWRLS